MIKVEDFTDVTYESGALVHQSGTVGWADVDEDEFVVDADDFAFDDLIDVDVLTAKPAYVVWRQLPDGVIPVILRNIELAD